MPFKTIGAEHQNKLAVFYERLMITRLTQSFKKLWVGDTDDGIELLVAGSRCLAGSLKYFIDEVFIYLSVFKRSDGFSVSELLYGFVHVIRSPALRPFF